MEEYLKGRKEYIVTAYRKTRINFLANSIYSKLCLFPSHLIYPNLAPLGIKQRLLSFLGCTCRDILCIFKHICQLPILT